MKIMHSNLQNCYYGGKENVRSKDLLSVGL